MKLASYTLVQCYYFFLFLFSIIVFFDVLIRFKSPIKLKTFFLLFVLSILVGSFCLFDRTDPDQYVLIRMICAMIIGTSMVQIFTNLYFIQHKRIANIYTIVAYAIYIFLIFYVKFVGYETVFPKSHSVNLPIYVNLLIELDFVLFNLFCLFIYTVFYLNFHLRIFILKVYNYGHLVFSWSF
jgi:hypothetical protein